MVYSMVNKYVWRDLSGSFQMGGANQMSRVTTFGGNYAVKRQQHSCSCKSSILDTWPFSLIEASSISHSLLIVRNWCLPAFCTQTPPVPLWKLIISTLSHTPWKPSIFNIKWCLIIRTTASLFSDCSVLRYSACCWHPPVPRPANVSPPSPTPTLLPAFERRLVSPCASTRVTGRATFSPSSPPSPSQLVSVQLVQLYSLQGSLYQYQQTGLPNSLPSLEVCVTKNETL